MEQDDSDGTVDEATAVRRQLTAACAAVEDANAHGLRLVAMVFGSEDAERMDVFGVDGVDIGEVLEAAAGQQWEPTSDQPLRGN
jgi:hypothetical protein